MKNLLIITQKVDEEDQALGFFIEWINQFSKHFSNVLVLCLEKGKYSLPSNVKVESLGKDRGISKISQFFNFYLYIFSKRNSYDAVFVHMNPIWMALGGLAWLILSKKRVLWYTHKSVTIRLKLASIWANVITTASLESLRIKTKKKVVTGHGIDTKLFSPKAESTPANHLLFVGRITPSKNFDILVNSARILLNKSIDFKITVVGKPELKSDQNYLEKLRQKINTLGLKDHFEFKGLVKHRDLPKIYNSHRIFIHSSRTGSLDKTVLEAMASGMDVISSNDASKSFLPEDRIFDNEDAEHLAEILENRINNPPNSNFRQYVLKHHNLPDLISRLSIFLKNNEPVK